VRRGRIKLALLAAFFILPAAASWVVWRFELVPGITGNYGTLLPPRPVLPEKLAPLKGRWVLVQFDGGACTAACERKLYIVRQVRKAQGKDMERIDRLWLLTDSGRPRAELVAALDGGHIAAADAELLKALPNLADVYLVDPLGNLMMRFPADADPTKMIKDLQRLLKYSSFG